MRYQWCLYRFTGYADRAQGQFNLVHCAYSNSIVFSHFRLDIFGHVTRPEHSKRQLECHYVQLVSSLTKIATYEAAPMGELFCASNSANSANFTNNCSMLKLFKYIYRFLSIIPLDISFEFLHLFNTFDPWTRHSASDLTSTIPCDALTL